MKPKNVLLRKSRLTVSKKCKAYSVSKLGLAAPDNRKAFYAGWDAAIEQALTPGEPVAWMHTGGHVHVRNPQWPPKTAALYTAEKGWTPLYTAPQPQREWVGLTDEEWQDLSDRYGLILFGRFKSEIEAKLREKNGGTK